VTGPAPAIRRAIAILESFAERGAPLTVSELARNLSLPKSSVSRILTELADRHWVDRDESGAYFLGSRLFALAEVAVPWDVMDRARRALPDLQEATGATSTLAVLEHFDVLYLARSGAKPSAVHAPVSMWERYPAHSTAVGKVLLAGLKPEWWREYVTEASRPGRPLARGGDFRPEVLEAEIKTVRAEGYAVDDGEYEEGLWCVAAPVVAEGRTIAAIGISLRSSKLEDGASRLVDLVRQACAKASENPDDDGRERERRNRSGDVAPA
jgi:DNA-binding IclR family transcriptional regulator